LILFPLKFLFQKTYNGPTHTLELLK
jgi:hypothetical protein